MSTIDTEVYDALIIAGADETRARETAKSVARYGNHVVDRAKASLLVLEWMVGFSLVFSTAILWRILTP